MIFFKKNKPTLSGIIPENYIDIHSHLLPGIDDGAKNQENTLFLFESMKNMGFSEIITTPHVLDQVWNNSRETIEKVALETATFLQEKDTQTKFSAAAEYMMDSSFVKLFESEKLLTLKNNYVLVEMSYLNPPINLMAILFDLQINGYQPVLAHPERYSFYHNALDNYKKLKKAGCLFQLNLLSTVGYYGKEVTNTADFLLKNEMYDFSGSDIHHTKHIESFSAKIKITDTKHLQNLLEKNAFFKR